MKLVPIRELATFKHGGTPSKANAAYWRGDIPWVSPKDMKRTAIDDAADHISQEAVAGSAASIVPIGSILIVVRSGILAHSLPVAQATKPLAFNQDIKAVLPKTGTVDADYLFWFLRAQEPSIIARGVKKGATVHSVQSGFIENLMVPLPVLPEQHRIVDLLTRAEGIVRLRREAAAKAAELIPAIFIDMFGDPAMNPKHWPQKQLGDCLMSADYGSSSKAETDGQGLPLIRMGNVSYAGELDLTNLKYVQLTDSEIQKHDLVPGDILFNRTNSKELVGKTGLWGGQCPAVVASYFIRLRVRPDLLEPTYLWALMNSKHMKKVLFETARGAIGQANINSKELKAFQIALPPSARQQEFAQRVEAIQSITVQQAEALKKAQATFNALLAQAFASPTASPSTQE